MSQHHQILGVPFDEAPRGIRSAYRDLARGCYRNGRAYRDFSDAYTSLESGRGIERPVRCARGSALSITEDFDAPEAEREALRETVRRNFTRVGLSKSEGPRVVQLEIEIIDDAPDAIELALTAYKPCAACHGSGHTGEFPCTRCDADGLVPVQAIARVGTDHAMLVVDPWREHGIHNVVVSLSFVK